MRRGIRQGCALSPLIYAIFSGWIYDQLCERVGEDWAREFVTLYVDDFLLQRLLGKPSDLEFMCRCVRATFTLLVDAGMCKRFEVENDHTGSGRTGKALAETAPCTGKGRSPGSVVSLT